MDLERTVSLPSRAGSLPQGIREHRKSNVGVSLLAMGAARIQP